MAFLYLIADFFINTFGITQPTEQMRKQAAWFIAGMTAFVLAGVALVGLIGLHLIGRK